MDNSLKSKERVDNEIRDAYMAFTLGVQAGDFDKYLHLVLDYMDNHYEDIGTNIQLLRTANPRYKKMSRKEFPKLDSETYINIRNEIVKVHKDLETILLENGCGAGGQADPKATCRKVLNTYIKTGFIKPLFGGYVPECRSYLEMDDKDKQKYLKGQIFFQYGSSTASYEQNYAYLPDGKVFRDIQFIFETLYRHPAHKLTREDIIGLMITVPFGKSKKFVRRNIELIKKGYLSKTELEEQYSFSNYIFLIKDKTIKNGLRYFESHFNEILNTGKIYNSKYGIKEFYNRKYNQVDFMMRAVADYPGIDKKDNEVFVKLISEDWEQEDKSKTSSKRSNVEHQMYRNYLMEESKRLYGNYRCFADKLPWKALVASHIVAFNDCEELGHKEWEYDGDNGLLLSPNIDAYFDKYDISFDDEGQLLLPYNESVVDTEIKEILIKYKLDKEILNESRKKYLEMHRSRFVDKYRKKE